LTIIRVPASTSNLGPGFDSHGLALALYLTLDVEPAPADSFVFDGEGADELERAAEENIILTAMRFAAKREQVAPQPARIRVTNEIPLARGLGSSGAAIIAGLSAFEVVTGRALTKEKLLAYATEIEGHSDNVSAALLGSFVVSCVTKQGEVLAADLTWPSDLRVVVVIPEVKVRTGDARAVLPETVSRQDAVFNIQRSSLMVAALAGGRYSLIGEAIRDRLHQPYRATLIPGLMQVLDMNGACDIPGLKGIALSGSGPTVVAFATADFDETAATVGRIFNEQGIKTSARVLDVDTNGRMVGRV
jgi:homoserine kinase